MKMELTQKEVEEMDIFNELESDTNTVLDLRNTWHNKDPMTWVSSDILNWIFFNAGLNDIPLESLKGEKFQGLSGDELCKMSSEEFSNRDHKYGQFLHFTLQMELKKAKRKWSRESMSLAEFDKYSQIQHTLKQQEPYQTGERKPNQQQQNQPQQIPISIVNQTSSFQNVGKTNDTDNDNKLFIQQKKQLQQQLQQLQEHELHQQFKQRHFQPLQQQKLPQKSCNPLPDLSNIIYTNAYNKHSTNEKSAPPNFINPPYNMLHANMLNPAQNRTSMTFPQLQHQLQQQQQLQNQLQQQQQIQHQLQQQTQSHQQYVQLQNRPQINTFPKNNGRNNFSPLNNSFRFQLDNTLELRNSNLQNYIFKNRFLLSQTINTNRNHNHNTFIDINNNITNPIINSTDNSNPLPNPSSNNKQNNITNIDQPVLKVDNSIKKSCINDLLKPKSTLIPTFIQDLTDDENDDDISLKDRSKAGSICRRVSVNGGKGSRSESIYDRSCSAIESEKSEHGGGGENGKQQNKTHIDNYNFKFGDNFNHINNQTTSLISNDNNQLINLSNNKSTANINDKNSDDTLNHESNILQNMSTNGLSYYKIKKLKSQFGSLFNQPNTSKLPKRHTSKILLSDFMKDLLNDPLYNPTCVRWEDKQKGIFRIVSGQSKEVASLWGKRKNNPKMNFEKMGRSLRWCRANNGNFSEVPKNHQLPKKLIFRLSN